MKVILVIIYLGPIEILFNLLEDRLIKVNEKAP